jgi:hypothetical protein
LKENILVTGSHRSGTTWVGQVIASAKNIRYIEEPFNKSFHKEKVPFENMYEYINNNSLGNQFIAKKHLESYYRLFSKLNWIQIKKIRSWNNGVVFFKDIFKRFYYRTLFKDPIALFSTEWIYENFNCKIVVLIRHPAAFVGSLKIKNWNFDFNNLKNQPQLLEILPNDFVLKIFEFSETQKDIIDQGILIWNIFYYIINQYQEKYFDQWYFIKHEDISMNPMEEFKKLFLFLELKMDKNTEEFIKVTSNSNLNKDLFRNSEKNIYTWKTRLTSEEILRVNIGTENIWKKFYSESDW